MYKNYSEEYNKLIKRNLKIKYAKGDCYVYV